MGGYGLLRLVRRDLKAAAWIGPIKRLASKTRTGAGAAYVLSDLDGFVEGSVSLPENKQFEALAFIDSQHVLVLRETRRGLMGDRDQHAVWTYDIRIGTSYRWAGNVDLRHSVVYAEY